MGGLFWALRPHYPEHRTCISSHIYYQHFPPYPVSVVFVATLCGLERAFSYDLA